jgi:hypothetical protein
MVSLTLDAGFTDAVVWEFSGIATGDPLATAAALSDGAATTNPLGPPITTTAPGELVIQAANLGGVETAVAAPFAEDIVESGDGWAHLAMTDAPPGAYEASWTATNGAYCATSAAFFVGP